MQKPFGYDWASQQTPAPTPYFITGAISQVAVLKIATKYVTVRIYC